VTTPSVSLRDSVRTAPRLLRIRIPARQWFVGAVRGERHWPSSVQVRETLEELGIAFLKFGQVLALRRDLLPDAFRHHAGLPLDSPQPKPATPPSAPITSLSQLKGFQTRTAPYDDWHLRDGILLGPTIQLPVSKREDFSPQLVSPADVEWTLGR
jgi:hypothetical protein